MQRNTYSDLQKEDFMGSSSHIVKKRKASTHDDLSCRREDQSSDFGNFTLQQLKQLSLFYVSKSTQTSSPSNNGLGTSPVGMFHCENIFSLYPILEEHIKKACQVNMIQDVITLFDLSETNPNKYNIPTPELWMNPHEKGFHSLYLLRCGLEAACALLSMMATPNLDRRIVNDEGIEACIDLIRHHVGKHVIPALSETGHLMNLANVEHVAVSKKRLKRKSCKDEPISIPQDRGTKDSTTISRNTAQSSSRAQNLMLKKTLKKIYDCIFSTIGTLSILMKQTNNLICTIQLDDQPLLSLTASLLSTVIIDVGAAQTNLAHCCIVQSSSFSLIETIFRRYSRHRTIILEDIFPLMLKLPGSKRSIRTFTIKSNISTNNCSVVMPMAALILSLIQACVVMPVIINEGTKEEGRKFAGGKNICKDGFSDGLSGCSEVCDYITINLLRRCAQKGEDGGASEFRPILLNLTEDLLALHNFPELPSADMLLCSICRQISHDLLRCAKGSSTIETTYITTALDCFGRVCASVSEKFLKYKISPFAVFPHKKSGKCAHESLKSKGASMEQNSCFCGRINLVDTFMLDCDYCHSWFHGSCVNVTKDNLPKVWICDACEMKKIVCAQIHKFTKKVSSISVELDNIHNIDSDVLSKAGIDEIHALRQILLNYFTQTRGNLDSMFTANTKEFHLSRWIKECNQKRNEQVNDKTILSPGLKCTYFLEQWESLDSSVFCLDRGPTRVDEFKTTSSFEQMQVDVMSKVVLALVVKTYDLSKAFPHLLGVLVQLMESNIVALRKLSVRALCQVISVDQNLMIQPTVRDAVYRRFSDSSISVREATISLVGSFLSHSPKNANIFHEPILSRLHDIGISVRKRAIRILRSLLLSAKDYNGRISACCKMLQISANPKEDSSVRDLIHETFKDIWFSHVALKDDGICNHKITLFKEHPGTAKFEKNKVSSGDESYIHAAAIQMIEVVASLGTTSFLTKLVKEMLNGRQREKGDTKNINEKVGRSTLGLCSKLVSKVMEELLAAEEAKSSIQIPKSALTTETDDKCRLLVAIISTLEAFGMASPVLLVDHFDTIIPYLKADNGFNKNGEGLIVHSVCKIFTCVLPLLAAGDIQLLANGDIILDFERIIYNFGSSAIDAAVEALSTLARHCVTDAGGSANKKIFQLANTFYRYLFKIRDSPDCSSENFAPSLKSNVFRSLATLGSICLHANSMNSGIELNNGEGVMNDLSQLAFDRRVILKESNICLECFHCILLFLEKEDPSTKCCALRSLICIFKAQPKLLLYFEQKGEIKKLISRNSLVELQCETLRCFKEILLTEEKRIESGEAKEKMELNKNIDVSKKISGDQDSDSSIAGSVIAQHSQRLYQMMTSIDPKIRFASVELIGHLLRQGMINPMDAVPYLFALQGDTKAPEVRSLAHKHLMIEGDKRPDMLRQRFCAGIRQAYLFQRALYPNGKDITAVIKEQCENGENSIVCIFGPIFRDFFKSKRTQRHGIILSLIMLFSTSKGNVALDSSLKQTTLRPSDEQCATVDLSMSKAPVMVRAPLLSYAAQILGKQKAVIVYPYLVNF